MTVFDLPGSVILNARLMRAAHKAGALDATLLDCAAKLGTQIMLNARMREGSPDWVDMALADGTVMTRDWFNMHFDEGVRGLIEFSQCCANGPAFIIAREMGRPLISAWKAIEELRPERKEEWRPAFLNALTVIYSRFLGDMHELYHRKTPQVLEPALLLKDLGDDMLALFGETRWMSRDAHEINSERFLARGFHVAVLDNIECAFRNEDRYDAYIAEARRLAEMGKREVSALNSNLDFVHLDQTLSQMEGVPPMTGVRHFNAMKLPSQAVVPPPRHRLT